jgi:transcriptional regulator with XRE-family HTH domain
VGRDAEMIPGHPTSVIAARVRALRKDRGWSAERLADAMREVGVPFDKTVVANLETGRRRFVTVQELLALAVVLGVAPTHLLVPLDDETPYALTPHRAGTAAQARAFVRGEDPLDLDPTTYFTEVPKSELKRALTEYLRGLP